MSVFRNYARYYDLLYRDKNYEEEARYVDGLIRKHASPASALLELGCGTGRHAELLIKRGFTVLGVDMSEEMLVKARERSVEGLEVALGDIRTFRSQQTFDAVISLFHVFSYQTSNASLAAAFATAAHHLRPGGILIFDCWYGPAVLADPPVVRIKRLEDDATKITRIAEPVLDPRQNIVDVNYEVQIVDKSKSSSSTLTETHRMRYLFEPEVLQFADHSGLSIVSAEEWLTGRTPDTRAWNVVFVCKK
jgi:SAM-dependent methyltransferase